MLLSIRRYFNRLRVGSAMNKIGETGETYLTRAVKTGDVALVRAFLDSGAHPNVKNAAGEYPAHIALADRHFHILDVLLDAGASVLVEQQGLTLGERAEAMGIDMLSEKLRHIENAQLVSLSGGTLPTPVVFSFPRKPRPPQN